MKKRKIPWFAIVAFLLAALLLPFFITLIQAFIDPAAHNYRLEYLRDGEAVDAYLHTSEYTIEIIFSSLLFVFLILFGLDLLLRKNTSRIAPIVIGMGVVICFSLTRVIWCFTSGGMNVVVGVLNILAVIGGIGSLFFFVKKSFDGDCHWPYYLCIVLTVAGFVFGSATQHSYSVLNALGHQGDVVYWGGYSITRLTFLTYILLTFVNLKSDFDPEPIKLQDAK
ncbi:MAG: hypothetical protein J6A47_01940 [Bacilli bacterium]|nr:hypothetical protein [Bacilli bacterium]